MAKDMPKGRPGKKKGQVTGKEAKRAAAYKLYTLEGKSYEQIGKVLGVHHSTVSRWVREVDEAANAEIPREEIADSLKRLLPQAVKGIQHHIETLKSRDNYRACEKLLETYGFLGALDGAESQQSEAEIIRDILDRIAAIRSSPYQALADPPKAPE